MGIIMQTYYNDQYQNVYVCCKIVIAILKEENISHLTLEIIFVVASSWICVGGDSIGFGLGLYPAKTGNETAAVEPMEK